MLISVIIPSYNQGQYIQEAINSVISQKNVKVEVIVVDGLSQDNTVSVLNNYKDKIIWFSEKDNGQADAINKGFRLAKGDILCWLNSDDLFYPDILEKVVKLFNDNPEYEMIYGNGSYVDQFGNVLGTYFCNKPSRFKWLYCGNIFVFQPSVFFKKTVIEKIGFLDENLEITLDHDYWIRMFLKKIKMMHVNTLFAKLRWYEESKTASVMGKHRFLHYELLKKHNLFFPKIYYYIRYILLINLKHKIVGKKRFLSSPKLGFQPNEKE